MNAVIVAYLYLSDLVDAGSGQLALIGVLYFGMEAVSDWIFVNVMVAYCGVPMLPASEANLAGADMMAPGSRLHDHERVHSDGSERSSSSLLLYSKSIKNLREKQKPPQREEKRERERKYKSSKFALSLNSE
jgi:hypothetical protein